MTHMSVTVEKETKLKMFSLWHLPEHKSTAIKQSLLLLSMSKISDPLIFCLGSDATLGDLAFENRTITSSLDLGYSKTFRKILSDMMEDKILTWPVKPQRYGGNFRSWGDDSSVFLHRSGLYKTFWRVSPAMPVSFVNLIQQTKATWEEGTSIERYPPLACLWTCLWGIFLVDDGCGSFPYPEGHATPGLIWLYEKVEQDPGSKPVNSVSPWILHQASILSSCFGFHWR